MSGAVVAEVQVDGLGHQIGIRPGDRVTRVDGRAVRDVIDYRFLMSAERLELELQRTDGQVWLVDVEKEPDETLGVEFESELFDGLSYCHNSCPFCFVDQMPQGYRDSLYIKDDDYRLSFMHGSFVTLTNLRDQDLERIVAQRLSPLYVSVHAVDPAVRGLMLGRQSPCSVMPPLRELAAAGIGLHVQVVLCPGLNDGVVLDQTLQELAALHPALLSIGIVPVSFSGVRELVAPHTLRPVTKHDAEVVIEQVSGWQSRLLAATKTRCVFLADEFFLLAGRCLPQYEHYESFPQLDNGIGSWRAFEQAFAAAGGGSSRCDAGDVVVATGTLVRPLLSKLLAPVSVLGVENTFLGPRVDVAGLMAGRDLARSLSAAGLDSKQRVLIPATACAGGEGREFIDSVTLDDVRAAVGLRVEAVEPNGEMLAAALVERK